MKLFEQQLNEALEAYLYHETNKYSLRDIAQEGLLPLSYGQAFVGDMGEMLTPEDFEEKELENLPPEQLIRRTYVSLKEPTRLAYGDVLLRFPTIISGKIQKDVDNYITKEIPPEHIEIKVGEQWVGIKKI